MAETAALPTGVFPTMITPFTEDGAVDYPRLRALTEWYIQSGCSGLFAVCLSSEMYHLTTEERLEVARTVKKQSAGRVPVVASGTFGGPVSAQAEFVRRMSEEVDAVVVLVNQMAAQDESDAVWRTNVETLMQQTGAVPLGLYECPKPYHRLLSAETLAWCAASGRFRFHKDTCCVQAQIKAKIHACAAVPSPFRFYNANVATALMSVRLGGSGFSGICANFYPQLISWLCASKDHELADEVQDWLSIAENVVMFKYPNSAKYFLSLFQGFGITTKCRNNSEELNEEEQTKLQALFNATAKLCARLGLKVLSPTAFL